MNAPLCRSDMRREVVRAREGLTGLDWVEVDTAQTTLTVHFIGRQPAALNKEAIRISGGRSARDAVRVVGLELYPADDPAHDDIALIRLDQPGDYSTYTLELVGLEDIDPCYARLDFSFKANCPSDLDCAPACPAPALPDADLAVDYLAKDYAGFRQLLLDRLAATCPDWTERHVPDIGITLVELLAYAGDYLSYYQDAVATEAYIGTARRRVSVRRHARLVDYRLSEGCNARACVAIETRSPQCLAPADLFFITRTPGLPESAALLAKALEPLAPDAFEVFEPVGSGPIALWPDHNRILIHDWGRRECCLPAGSTSAMLRGRLATGGDDVPTLKDATTSEDEAPPVLRLSPGDIVIFEEVLGPATGNPADSDRSHRQAVRLTSVTAASDPLLGIPLVAIEWHEEDALAFDLCLSALGPAPDCAWLDPVSVVRGNVVPVDHGQTLPPEPIGAPPVRTEPACCECEGHPGAPVTRAGRFRPRLQHAPLTFASPTPPDASARAFLAPSASGALPEVRISGEDGSTWEPAFDLLSSDSDDRRFVAELEEDGTALLRFGDGWLGAAPTPDVMLSATARIGNGPAGNVGAEAIGVLVHRQSDLSNDIALVRNPLPASGGTRRETMDEALLMAPVAYRSGPAAMKRAITAEDYARIAERDPRVQSAACRLAWTGSWYVADVGLDARVLPSGDFPDTVADTAARLEQVRRIGHALSVRAAEAVPVDLALHVCVLPGYVAAHVKAAVLEALSSRSRTGFWHPDNFVCGMPVRLSAIMAAVHRVPGVSSVHVLRFQRQFEAPAGEIAAGILPIGPWEVAVLANDPNRPEAGILAIDVEGGR